MNIIDSNGDYQYVSGTKILAESDHPVFQARIELALDYGSWLYAPDQGHRLKRFQRMKQTPQVVDEFKKDLSLYLDRYHPSVRQILVDRDGITVQQTISQEALNGVL